MRKLAILLTLLIALASPVAANTTLTALIAAQYGTRSVSPELMQIASQRAVEISCSGCFSHAGYRTTAEVIAWNRDITDPLGRLVLQWIGSPPHNAILADHALSQIGCGTHTVGDATYGVCVLNRGTTPLPSVIASPPTVVRSVPVPLVPNTAVSQKFSNRSEGRQLATYR